MTDDTRDEIRGATADDEEPLLAVEELRVRYHGDPPVTAVDGVSFELRAGERLGVVGESGAGKSAMVRALVGLVGDTGEVSGSVRFRGTELVGADARTLRSVRGSEVAMVFQNAGAAFDPSVTVGAQIAEAVRAAGDATKREARERAADLLAEVGIGDPEGRLDAYPHEFSGGMAQRAAIAMALAGDPELLLADEPTTGLDVSVQAGIVDLFRDLAEQRDTAVLLISHDLGVVSQLCERMAVLYAGRVAERGSRRQLLETPKHPYTRAFLRSVPDVDVRRELEPIPGSPPNPENPPAGCRFYPRCQVADAGLCDAAPPPTVGFGDGHEAACYAYTEGYAGDADEELSVVESVRRAGGDEEGER